MRRTVSFVLVLVIMLSLACPVFATAVDSIPDSAPTEATTPSGDTDNPKTGDVIMTWAIVLVLSLIALISVVWIYRKKIA